MKSRIFKYPLEIEHRQMLQMHETARPLWVTEQNELLVLYAQVNWPYPGDIEPRLFQVVTTGDVFETRGKNFVGACTLGGWFQAFVFELERADVGREGDGDAIDMSHDEDFQQIRQAQVLRSELEEGGLVGALFNPDSALRKAFSQG